MPRAVNLPKDDTSQSDVVVRVRRINRRDLDRAWERFRVSRPKTKNGASKP